MEKRRKLEYQLQVKNLLLELGRELTELWLRQSFIEQFFKNTCMLMQFSQFLIHATIMHVTI